MTRLILTGVPLIALLSGCVSGLDIPGQTSNANSEVVCVKEKKTGSNRTTTRCHPGVRSEIQKEKTQQDMRRIQSQTH
jgi:hypothetical protein